MSWKRSGQLIGGPPTTTNANKLDPRFRPNLGGLTAFQREQQLSGRYGSEGYKREGKTEWDVLRENHRFIRDDEEPGEVSWEERLARAYESKLFKEFALIDLKHYKSRRLALRWRTAPEVVQGIGEETCGSLRCKYHTPPTPEDPGVSNIQWEDSPGPSASQRGPRVRKKTSRIPPLRAFELPFVYEEAGERKEALVKVKLCKRCEGKLTWKPGKEEINSEEEGKSEDNQEVDEEKARKEWAKESSRREERDSDTHRRKERPEDDRLRVETSGKRDRNKDRDRNYHTQSGPSYRRRRTTEDTQDEARRLTLDRDRDDRHRPHSRSRSRSPTHRKERNLI